jgi:hypothetical protein
MVGKARVELDLRQLYSRNVCHEFSHGARSSDLQLFHCFAYFQHLLKIGIPLKISILSIEVVFSATAEIA